MYKWHTENVAWIRFCLQIINRLRNGTEIHKLSGIYSSCVDIQILKTNYSFANHHQKYITIVFCCLVKVYLMEVNMASTPASPPLPYVRHDVPLMCHWELRTAGWEVGRTLRAHEARQDQAAQREEAFLCIHEYHSGERQTKNKEHRKLMAFLYLRGHRGRGCYLTSTRRRLQSKKRKCCYWYSWYQEMELEISSAWRRTICLWDWPDVRQNVLNQHFFKSLWKYHIVQ